MEQGYYIEEEPESSYTWIIVTVVILIVVGILVWLYFRGNSVLDPVYTFPSSGSTGTESFAATNFSIYTAAAPSTGMKLTVTAVSTDPTGQQFIIDNSSGTGAVTIVGPSTSSNKIGTLSSNIVAAKTVGSYVWKSSTTLLRTG